LYYFPGLSHAWLSRPNRALCQPSRRIRAHPATGITGGAITITGAGAGAGAATITIAVGAGVFTVATESERLIKAEEGI
jgi:hypothetical protein